MAAKSKFKAFNVFCGGETYLLNREKEKALAWPDRDIIYLDGKGTSESELLSALDTPTLDGSGVAVVLDNADKVKLGKFFKEYLEGRNPQDKTSVLAAIIRSDKNPKAWNDVAQAGRLIQHKKLRAWDTKSIEQRVHAEAARLDLKVDASGFKMLLRLFAENVGGIVNELQKILFLVGPAGTVTKKEVLAVSPKQLPIMPWDVAEAAMHKSKKQALTMTGLLFKYEGDGVAVPIVASLMKQVERLLIARSLTDRGKGSAEIGAAINLNPYVFEKKYAPSVRRHTAESLLVQMNKLCELETRVKGPAPSKRTLVELAVLSLAS